MKTNCIRRKRAFTLTELLIVVIVIGVLSAVTLPKFNRVIENRKVTEAEEMMSAVRMEQERRCSLDQNYTTNFSNLSDVISSANTKNYTYSLQPQGISAQSASGDYTLKILSYEDGSYCCTGAGCKKLNKNYPDCATLSFPTSNCAGTEGGGEPEPGTDPEEPKGCDNTPRPADETKNCECGTVTASYVCDAATNTWKLGEFPACPSKPEDETEKCSPCGEERTKTYSCVDGKWTGTWSAECKTDCPCEEKIEAGGAVQGQLMADTCDGNRTARYTCDGHFNGTCVDVYEIGGSGGIQFPTISAGKYSFYFELAQANPSDLPNGYTPCPNGLGDNTVCPPGYVCQSGNCVKGSGPELDDTVRCPDGYYYNTTSKSCVPYESVGSSVTMYRKVTCCGDGEGGLPPIIDTKCTPGKTETKTESCGVGSSSTKECTRTCGANGTWGAWSCDDSTCKTYKCLVNAQRRTTGSCDHWVTAAWTMDMKADCNAVGLTSCQPGKECNCEVGKNYVYVYTWGCCRGNDKYCSSFSAYNYACVTCGEVDNLSKCYKGDLRDPGSGGGGFIPECSNREDKEKCESCGGTWNTKTCTCDCGFYQGNSCRFDSRRGCVCGSLVRACR